MPQSRKQPALSVRGLTLWRSRTILKGIDWTVRRGEHWVILGANGSGKTSLLRAITGLFPPSDGSIELLGNTYGESDWPSLRKRVGWVSSSVKQAIEPGELAWEVIAGGPRAMVNVWGDFDDDEIAHVDRILSRVNCAHMRDEPWQNFSQGERQRLLIGRALAANPDLLILDEPCAGLDPVAREHFLGFLGRLARRRTGPPLIFVTHHVEEIIPEITHALLLREGRVLGSGPVGANLNSASLSALFGTAVELRKSGSRYRLTLRDDARTVF